MHVASAPRRVAARCVTQQQMAKRQGGKVGMCMCACACACARACASCARVHVCSCACVLVYMCARHGQRLRQANPCVRRTARHMLWRAVHEAREGQPEAAGAGRERREACSGRRLSPRAVPRGWACPPGWAVASGQCAPRAWSRKRNFGVITGLAKLTFTGPVGASGSPRRAGATVRPPWPTRGGGGSRGGGR